MKNRKNPNGENIIINVYRLKYLSFYYLYDQRVHNKIEKDERTPASSKKYKKNENSRFLVQIQPIL